MEKKTIGKFISALRRAHGMTQKELGDRLFVSDKTVSRWERDECDPELSLIPVIADIFGITTDELLRGERNSARHDPAEPVPHTAARSTKQLRALLDRHLRLHRNVSVLSVAVGLLGLIAAAICNLGFSRGLLGFCIALIFILGAVCIQLCITNLLYIHPDEDYDDAQADAIRRADHSMVELTMRVLVLLAVLTAFLLPIAVIPPDAYWGLEFGAWMGYGLLFATVTFFALHVLDVLWLHNLLVRHGLLLPEEAQQQSFARRRTLLKRMGVILLISESVLLAALFVQNQWGLQWLSETITFDTREEFVDYMYQQSYRKLYADCFGEVSPPVSRDTSVMVPVFPEDVYHPDSDVSPEALETMLRAYVSPVPDAQGNTLFEYVDYQVAYEVSFSFDTSPDGLPITVITYDARQEAWHKQNDLLSLLSALMVLDGVLCAGIYLILSRRKAK